MSIQLLTTCKPESIRATADHLTNYTNRLSDEFTPLNLKALALMESDWEGEARNEFRETWINFREGCAILVDVMRDAEPILMRLFVRLSIAKDRFEKAVAEAQAAGLQVDLTTGEVTPPPVVLTDGSPFPFGNGELEVADQVRRANLDIQDAVREATEADQRAEEELDALKPSINRVTPILKALSVAVDGYDGIAGAISGVATGIARSPASTAAQEWRMLANHPVVRAAGTPLAAGVPVLRSIPALSAIVAPMTWWHNVQEGDNPARSATRAVTSTASTVAVGSMVAAGASMAAAASPSLAAGPAGVALVAGAFVVGVVVSGPVQQLGDELGQTIHDSLISPAAYGIKGAWNHVFT